MTVDAHMGSVRMDPSLSDHSASPGSDSMLFPPALAPKRTAAEAGLKPNGMRPHKSVKRRASKACQCCRARKVRCNVVEHGAPCTNCRLDEVECIISESKRKRKWSANEAGASPTSADKSGTFEGTNFPMSAHPPYEPLKKAASEHIPHTLYQDLDTGRNASITANPSDVYHSNPIMNLQRLGIASSTADPRPLLPQLLDMPTYSLPAYIKPLHNRLTPDDILYLERKGALTLPPDHLRDELLRCYVEFVHPYMPLLDLHDTIHIIDKNDGERSISLLLFQAIMFAGVATVDIRYLKAAGYATRRDARRLFFQKTRLLYDFDYEVDRISLIQSLLLMTYWYETPDDQKDSHHWMGIAVSLSHTIGLHRNPEKSTSMAVQRQRLWKRIWWSTYMRDRLIALGMRRPTRIKGADFDVPMLTVEDFEDAVLPDGPSCIPAGCSLVRSKEKQRQLAILCIEKAKLCLCISHVLSVQYSVLNSNHGVISEEGSTKTTMMLMAKRLEPEQDQLQSCDQELQDWYDGLAEEAQYVEPAQHDVYAGNEDIVLNRSLLHLIFNATLSALHRPQVLPSTVLPQRNTQGQLDISRKSVRTAANRITSIAHTLHNLDMVRFLPTTGITVLLPAIIIHLLDIKSPDEITRRTSLQGFCQCMQIMAALRDIYAAADYSTAFLEAAIRKAEITLPAKSDEAKESRNIITSAAGLMDAANRLQPSSNFSNPHHQQHRHNQQHHHTLSASTIPDDARMTPPDSDSSPNNATHDELRLSDNDMAHQLHHYLASTPPDSENHLEEHLDPSVLDHQQPHDFEPDFDSMINLDAAGEIWSVDDGAFAAMQGESGGFAMEVDWMKGMKDDGGFGAIAIPGSPELAT